MTQVMKGVRVLEVAQFVFVPSAGAVLADWGADVVKVEHPLRGDAQRGARSIGGMTFDPVANPMMQHPNRGKRSIAIDLAHPEGRELVYELARDADVFLTNYLPSVRQKLGIDLEHIRAVNPKIIYARGSGYGDKGPDRDRGGYDMTAFWIHSGIAHAMTPQEYDVPLQMGVGGMGGAERQEGERHESGETDEHGEAPSVGTTPRAEARSVCEPWTRDRWWTIGKLETKCSRFAPNQRKTGSPCRFP